MRSFNISDLKKFDISDVFPSDVSEVRINSYSDLSLSTSDDLTFVNVDIVSKDRYLQLLSNAKSKLVIIDARYFNDDFKKLDKVFLFSQNPRLSFFKIAEYIKSFEAVENFEYFNYGTCKGACDKYVQIHKNVIIEEFSKIESKVCIEEGTFIDSGVVIKSGVKIGKNCKIHPNVFLEACEIGDGVEIFSGAVIGKSGFGFELNNQTHKFETIPHIGKVKIGNFCKIGANTCIDRGTVGDTVLEDCVMIDNLVQIAHNVKIGAYTCVAGQSGIAGSTRIGKKCLIGGGARISGHLKIEDEVVILGSGMVTKNAKAKSKLSSVMPAEEQKDWNKFVAKLRQIARRP